MNTPVDHQSEQEEPKDTYTIPKGNIVVNAVTGLASKVIGIISKVGAFPAVIEAGQKVGADDFIIQTFLRMKGGIIAGVDVASLYTNTLQKWQLAQTLEAAVTKQGGTDNLSLRHFKMFADIFWPVVDATVKAANSLKSPDQIQTGTAMVFMVLLFGFIIPEFTKFVLKRDKADVGHKLRILAMQYIREKLKK